MKSEFIGLALVFISCLVQPVYAEKQPKEISNVADTNNYSPSEVQLLAQRQNNSVVKVTGVKVNPTDKGMEVILESPNIEALQPVNKSLGNNFIVEIPNTVLSLGTQKSFNQKNPAAGITSVSVTQTNTNTIKLTVTGEKALPTAELFDDDEGLVFDLTLVVSSSQPPSTSATASSQPLVDVTGVKLNPTEKSLEIILETAKGDQLEVILKTEGKTYIADIPKAQLKSPFRQETPLAGISEITVNNLDANTIRLKVITDKDLPQVELFDGDEGLIFSVTPAMSSTQPPQKKPIPPSTQSEKLIQPEKPTTEAEKPK